MKHILFIIFFLLSTHYTNAQQKNEDSLKALINQHKGDRAEVDALVHLGHLQQELNLATRYAEESLSLAKKIKYRKGEADCYFLFRKIHNQQGNFSHGIRYALDALAIYEDLNDHAGIASAHAMLQAIYRAVADYRKSLSHAFVGLQTAEAHNVMSIFDFPGHRWAPLLSAEIGGTYVLMNLPDSALLYTQKSIAQKELFNGAEWGFPVYLLATILNMKGQFEPALEKYRESLVLSVQNGFPHDTLQIFSGMSTLFKNSGQADSALHYAHIVVQGWTYPSEFKNLLEAVINLAQVYKAKGNKDSAFRYTELSYAIKDSIFSAEKDRAVQRIAFDAQLKEEEFKAAQIEYRSKVQLYVLITGLLVMVLITAILWRNNHHKQKAKAKIEQAYKELKSTQAQLIQKEKMASLGELTAGIAHEIQNPLNFVNNFSEVNDELIEELKNELQADNKGEALAIADDIKVNGQKINYHGQRADAIVKSMLQHSRVSTDKKESTDINALADEYLRLSYHGFRAKDKEFNVNFTTDFDGSIGKIALVPQDIGRVLLNLYNNAFYAVNERRKAEGLGYEPTVSVATIKIHDHVEVRVKDNGNGIHRDVADKVFQPFFTTKPTGQGTGLGLSLSYDIIKAHGGELRLETKEGEGAEFIIYLPV